MFEIKLFRPDFFAVALGVKQEIVTTLPDSFNSAELAASHAERIARFEPGYTKVEVWSYIGDLYGLAVRSVDGSLVWAD